MSESRSCPPAGLTHAADRVVWRGVAAGPLRYLEDVPVEAAAEAFGVALQEVDLSTPTA